LVQFERLATLGQLSAEVAHRIKGPLTTIMVNAEVLAQRGRRTPQELGELSQIRDEVGHCRDILKGLLDLGRIEEMARVRFDMREPLRHAIDAVTARLRKHRVRLDSSLAEPLPVEGDAVLMQEALLALLHNAADAVRAGGHIRVAARVASGRFDWRGLSWKPSFCEVSVEDDGRGIQTEDLERIFEPFFTTKGKDGSGLGLSAALRVLQKHGGTIEAFSDGAGRGARFVLSLPRRG
jgi:signal transduction histidine kinase